MKPYKVLKEHDTHFEVDDGSGGKPFKVAKGALRHTTVEKIRQHFADGGEVQPLPFQAGDLPPSAYELANGLPGGGSFGLPEPVAASGARSLADLLTPTPAPDRTPYGARLAAAPTPAATASPEAIQGVPPMLAAPPPDAPAAPAAAPASAGTPDPAAPAGVAAGEKSELAGIKQRATIAGQEGDATAKLVDNLNTQRAALAQQSQKELAENQARADDLRTQIQTGAVDPNRLWNSASTGQRISASIGLILGGLGSGLTGGPNMALQVMEKSIDRDLEAQRLDLGRKESLLQSYVQRGHDLRSAQSLAKADLLDVFSGQLQKVAAQYQGSRAAADALVASGQVQQKSAELRQEGQLRSLSVKQKQLEIEHAKLQMEMQRKSMGGLQQFAAAAGQQMDVPLRPEAVAMLPEKLQETFVETSPGRYRQAISTDAAKKVNDAMTKAGQLEQGVNELAALAKAHPAGTWSAAENQKARAAADLLKVGLFGTTEDQKRFTETEKHLADEIVADPTSFWKSVSGGNTGRLDALKDILWTHRASVLNNYTRGMRLPLRRPQTGG